MDSRGFKKIAVAITFSPRLDALLSEVNKLIKLYNATLQIIHVGVEDDIKKGQLQQLLQEKEIDQGIIKIHWEKGDPAKGILKISENEQVDLLVIGALEDESIFKYYILNSISRKILRKSHSSVFVTPKPSKENFYDTIVASVNDQFSNHETIAEAVQMAHSLGVEQITLVRESQMIGLASMMTDEHLAKEKQDIKRKFIVDEHRKVNEMLLKIDTLGIRVKVKVLLGKPGYELRKFLHEINADVLFFEKPTKSYNIIDRVFQHDLEYLLESIPCNILLVNKK